MEAACWRLHPTTGHYGCTMITMMMINYGFLPEINVFVFVNRGSVLVVTVVVAFYSFY